MILSISIGDWNTKLNQSNKASFTKIKHFSGFWHIVLVISGGEEDWHVHPVMCALQTWCGDVTLSCSVHSVPHEHNTSWALCKQSLRDATQTRASVGSSSPAFDPTSASSSAIVSSSVETHCTEIGPTTLASLFSCCFFFFFFNYRLVIPANKPLSAVHLQWCHQG